MAFFHGNLFLYEKDSQKNQVGLFNLSCPVIFLYSGSFNEWF